MWDPAELWKNASATCRAISYHIPFGSGWWVFCRPDGSDAFGTLEPWKTYVAWLLQFPVAAIWRCLRWMPLCLPLLWVLGCMPQSCRCVHQMRPPVTMWPITLPCAGCPSHRVQGQRQDRTLYFIFIFIKMGPGRNDRKCMHGEVSFSTLRSTHCIFVFQVMVRNRMK